MLKLWERYDFKKYRWMILLLIVLICTAGIYVLGHVQGEEEVDMVSRQIKGLIGGILLAVFVSMFDYHFVCKFSVLMYILIKHALCTSLSLTYTNKRRTWFSLRRFSVQKF